MNKLKKLLDILYLQDEIYSELSRTKPQITLNVTNELKCSVLESIIESKDLKSMLLAERSVLVHQLDRFKDSATMEKTYSEAIENINIMLYALPAVYDPDHYKFVADNCFNLKNKRNNLPYDQVLRGFDSHRTRLINFDKEVDHVSDKLFLHLRKINWATAANIYKQLQKSVVEQLNWDPNLFKMTIDEISQEVELKRDGTEPLVLNKKFIVNSGSGFSLAPPNKNRASVNPEILKSKYLNIDNDGKNKDVASKNDLKPM